jgi:hypothetical protein
LIGGCHNIQGHFTWRVSFHTWLTARLPIFDIILCEPRLSMHLKHISCEDPPGFVLFSSARFELGIRHEVGSIRVGGSICCSGNVRLEGHRARCRDTLATYVATKFTRRGSSARCDQECHHLEPLLSLLPPLRHTTSRRTMRTVCWWSTLSEQPMLLHFRLLRNRC